MRDRLKDFDRRDVQLVIVTTGASVPVRGSHLILSDPATVVSATYGVPFQFGDGNRPATFVMDRKGVIRFLYLAGTKPGHVFYSTEPQPDAHWSYDRPSADELFRVIDGVEKRTTEQEQKLAALRKAGVSALIRALQSEESYLRAEAASVLAGMGTKADAAVPALVAALQDKVGYVRSEAARALGKIGAKAEPAVPVLIALLKDQDEGVRAAAAAALGGIGPEAKGAVRALLWLAAADPFGGVQDSASEAVGRIGPAAIPDLKAALKADQDQIRLGAVRGLMNMGPKAEEAHLALTESLKDSNAHVRAGSAQALGRIGTPARSAVPALREALKDKYGGARMRAINALGRIDPETKGLAAVLVAALADEESRVRHAAASTLAQVRPLATEAVPALKAALKDSNSYVRLAAAVSLSRIDPGSKDIVVPILVPLLKDEEPDVRVGAAALLESIDPAAAKKAAAAEQEARDALSKFDRHWKPYSGEPNLGDPRWKLKMEVLVRLAQAGPAALPLLEAAAKKGSKWSESSREFAEESLPMLRKDESRKALADYDLTQMDSARVGKSAPDFALKDAAGKTHHWSEFRDQKIVVLAFVIQDT